MCCVVRGLAHLDLPINVSVTVSWNSDNSQISNELSADSKRGFIVV